MLSEELKDAPFECVPTTKVRVRCPSDEMRVLAWLRGVRPQIIAAEKRFNVDRRAIAGAIAWEALENPHPTFFLWPGAGKVHSVGYYSGTHIPGIIGGPPSSAESVEQMGYLKKQSWWYSRSAVLKTPTGAIFYIAAIMRMGADLAENRGFIINDKPDLLTEFYQAWTPDKWSANLASKPGPPRKLEAPDRMAVWVKAHLSYLGEAVGMPSLVPACVNTRTGEPVGQK
jgi:hypothetical protein